MRIFSLDPDDYSKIDDRLIPFLNGWTAEENYKNKKVLFPGTWNSSIHPYKYFEEIKKPGDPNYDSREEENEIGLCLWAGWKQDDNKAASDDEIDIRLFILGKDVLSGKNKISAEIHKMAGAEISLSYNGKHITNFTKNVQIPVEKSVKVGWWESKKIVYETQIVEESKIWIEDMVKFL